MLWTMLKILAGGGSNAALDTIMHAFDAKLAMVPDKVEPPPGAPRRRTFTSTIPVKESSVVNMSARQRMTVGPTMLRLIRQMNKSSGYYAKPLRSPLTHAEPEVFSAIEAVARQHGATAVRYVRVADDDLFADLGVPHRNAIIFTVPMDKVAMDTAPSFECFHEVAMGYLRLATTGNAVADHLRAQGFAAYPGTALGGLSDYSRLGERAGLGTIGYHGMLITPQDGALLRINVIYTSIDNIAVEAPQTTSWIRDFCSKCRKCVRECPPGAIHEAPIRLENGRVQCIDTTACLDEFSRNFGCAICIDVCPFTQKGLVVLQERFKGNPDAPHYDLVPATPSS